MRGKGRQRGGAEQEMAQIENMSLLVRFVDHTQVYWPYLNLLCSTQGHQPFTTVPLSHLHHPTCMFQPHVQLMEQRLIIDGGSNRSLQ